MHLYSSTSAVTRGRGTYGLNCRTAPVLIAFNDEQGLLRTFSNPEFHRAVKITGSNTLQYHIPLKITRVFFYNICTLEKQML